MVCYLCIDYRKLAWIILFFGALNVIFLGGKRRAFGAFITQLHTEFNTTLTELDWIGDSYSAFGCLTATLSTAIIIRFGRRYGLFQFLGACFILASCATSAIVPNPHWMFLTHTVLHGIGSSIVLSNIGLVINEHFPKSHQYRLLATSLISGGSVASLAFVYAFAILIETFDWRIAMYILGGAYFLVMGLPSLFFTKTNDSRQDEDTRRFLDVISGKHAPLMTLWFLERTVTSIVTYGLIMNLTQYVYNRNPNLGKSTILMMLFAGGEASTYLFIAIITAITKALLKNRLKFVLLFTTSLAAGCLAAMEFLTEHKQLMMVLSFFAGFGLGPSNSLLFPAGEELTRLPGHLAYPFTLAGMGCGIMVSPLLSGKIMETFRDKWFFLVQGALLMLKVLILLILTIILFVYRRVDDPDYKVMFSIVVPEGSEYDKLLANQQMDPEESKPTLSLT